MLKNKIAIITGSGQGMGKQCALTLSKMGMKTVINDLDETKAQNTADIIQESGSDVLVACGNVSLKNDVQEVIGKTIKRFGSIHVLINNAGILRPTKFLDISEDEWDWIISVNLKGTFLFSQAVLFHMRKQGWGRIINFSSTAGKNVSTVGGAHYTAAKAGILGLTRHLATEESSFGITVNAVCPGLIDTEMVRETVKENDIKKYIDSFPIKRLGTPNEVASLVGFLVSEDSGYITGASFDINGGDLMV